MDRLDCDPVMDTKMDCLTEGIERLSEDCADQVRLTAKVIAKVNNADITVTSDEGGHLMTKVHSGEYEAENWQCPADFMEHNTHTPCCFFAGDCNADDHSLGHTTKFQCARKRCNAVKGEWALKDEEGYELGGHLCCPRKKAEGFSIFFSPKDSDKDDATYLLANGMYSNSGTLLFLLATAGIAYWQRARLATAVRIGKEMAFNDVQNVQMPGLQAIELTTLFNTLFSAVKKDADFIKPPVPTSKGTGASTGVYGGL